MATSCSNPETVSISIHKLIFKRHLPRKKLFCVLSAAICLIPQEKSCRVMEWYSTKNPSLHGNSIPVHFPFIVPFMSYSTKQDYMMARVYRIIFDHFPISGSDYPSKNTVQGFTRKEAAWSLRHGRDLPPSSFSLSSWAALVVSCDQTLGLF